MGVNNPKLGEYVLQVACGLVSPADGATQIFAGVPSIGPAGTDYYIVLVPKAGRVKRVDLIVYVAGTLGTTENATASLRLNEATDTTISSAVQHNTARQTYSAALDVAVAQGDRLAIKVVCPTFATNPTNVLYSGNIYIEGVA